MARFRHVSSAVLYARAALGAVWRSAVPAVSVCAVAFTETAGAGTKIAGGAVSSGRVNELTQRLVVLEVHVLASTRGM
jgi:hypothetical protein